MSIRLPSEGKGVQGIEGTTLSSGAQSRKDVPLVTFVMPCYNSADFMLGGIESMLDAGHDCEIILINDGSSDDTEVITRYYAQNYEHVRAVTQENANWGGVVNNGLSLARGKYFKVLDADDHFDMKALARTLDALARCVEQGQEPDLLITNYVYDHMNSNSQRLMEYRSFFPANRTFTWDEMGRPGLDKFIMIHAAWYKTDILRSSGIMLPTGVSYMDSLLLLHPMPYAKTVYYLDEQPYHYLIGREGQSVEIAVVKKNIDQQLLATKLAIDDADYAELFADEPNRAMLMVGYLSCMMSVSTLHLFMIGTPEALRKNDELWAYLRQKNPVLYDHVRRSWAGRANRKTALGRKIAQLGYAVAKRIYKFA